MSKIQIFGRMWPRIGLARLSSQFFSFFFKSSLVRAIAILALVPMIQACDVIRNSPGHRAMYYYDSIQDAAIRQYLEERGERGQESGSSTEQEGGLNDE